jgi:hypothetical protein
MPVKLFCGLLLSKESSFDKVLKLLEELNGTIDYVSPLLDFSVFSNYYEQEMGCDIRRYFVSFTNLINRIELPDIKNRAISTEKNHSVNDKRMFNIDPGYLALGQVFLASTKDNFCRVYVRDGIYVEVTLRYIKNSYTPFPYTYRDYRSEEYLDFFNSVRKIYKEQLHGVIDTLS